MVVSRETVGLSNIVRKFLPPFVHTVWETLKYRNVWHLRSLARCNFQETKTPFIKPIEIKYIKSWVFKVHRGNDNSYRLLITRQLLFIDNNKRWYNGCRQESYRCPFPHSPHTLTLNVQFGIFLILHNILIWPAVSTHLSLWLFRNWKEIAFSLESKHRSGFVIVSERAYCDLRFEMKQNEKMLFVRLTLIVNLR